MAMTPLCPGLAWDDNFVIAFMGSEVGCRSLQKMNGRWACSENLSTKAEKLDYGMLELGQEYIQI